MIAFLDKINNQELYLFFYIKNMADSVSVSSRNSYGSRVKNSFSNILWGIVFVIASICLLAWNENNYVKQKAALKEWASLVNETTANQINSELEWKEVHLSRINE